MSGPGHTILTGFFLLYSAAALGQCVSVELDEFPSPKRVGVEEIDRGRDTVLIGFDLRPDGTPIEGGAIVDSAFEGLGVHFSAVVTEGPLAGSRVSAQALHIVEAKASVSAPNILSGADPQGGPNTSGRITGTATIIATFLTTEGKPARSRMVGASNDLMFGHNTLTAYSEPDGTGEVLGSVSATGPGDFFGLSCPGGIGSVSFSGFSTEVDDFVFTPAHEPELQIAVSEQAEITLCSGAEVQVFLRSGCPVEALSLGVSHDPSVLSALRAVPAPVWAGELPDFAAVSLWASAGDRPCAGAGGVVLAFVGSTQEPASRAIPPGSDSAVATIVYEAAAGAAPGRESPIEVVSCLAPPGLPATLVTVTCNSESRADVFARGGVVRLVEGNCRRRGLCNSDSRYDISDVLALLAFLFSGGGELPCQAACDCNGGARLDVSDAICFLGHLFQGGPAPSPLYAECP